MNTLFKKLRPLLLTPWTLVIVLLLGFAGFSLMGDKRTENTSVNNATLFPNTFMTNVETRVYSNTGQLQHRLVTPRITQYQVKPEAPSAADYTLLETPLMTFYDQNPESPWHLSAELGRSDAAGKTLTFTQNVLIQQKSPERGEVKITTSELLIHPDKQFAETDKAVTMRSVSGQVDAIGMEAEMLENKIQLKSNVRAVYDPR